MYSKTTISYYQDILTAIFTLIMIWALLLQIQPEKTTDWNYLFNSGYAIIFLFSGFISLFLLNKVKISGLPYKAIGTSSLALISYGAGLVIWTVYNFYYSAEIPYPSMADFFFVSFYPIILISIFYYLQIFSFVLKRRILVESLIVLIILSFIIFSILGIEIPKDKPIIEKILDVFYPLSSAIVISGSLMIMRVSGGAVKGGSYYLSLGLLAHGLADFFFSIRTSAGTYWNGDYVDILFAISAFLTGMASFVIISNLIPEPQNVLE